MRPKRTEQENRRKKMLAEEIEIKFNIGADVGDIIEIDGGNEGKGLYQVKRFSGETAILKRIRPTKKSQKPSKKSQKPYYRAFEKRI